MVFMGKMKRELQKELGISRATRGRSREKLD